MAPTTRSKKDDDTKTRMCVPLSERYIPSLMATEGSGKVTIYNSNPSYKQRGVLSACSVGREQMTNFADSIHFRVQVRTLTGTVFQVDCAPYYCVLDLKRNIFREEGFPVGQQRLIYRSERLKDRKSVRAYGLQPDCLIFLVLKLRGVARTKQTATRSGALHQR